MISIHGKSQTIYVHVVIILQHWPWGQEAWGILGRSSELASPPNGHQLLSEYPKPSREAQARPTAGASPQSAGDKLPGWAQAPCTHNRRYLQTQQGLAPGQGFQGQASSISREQQSN